FPIGRTVRTFKLVSRLPEMGRIIPGPFRHVPVCGIFQILTVAFFWFGLVFPCLFAFFAPESD
ncbi:hypothetical protein ACSLNR_28065, partial [Escherichia coli]